LAAWVGCSAGSSSFDDDDDGTPSGGGSGGTHAGGASQGGGLNLGGMGQGGACGVTCSSDLHHVVDCNGNIIETCTGLEGCDVTLETCTNACQAAENNRNSIGCRYYATDMQSSSSTYCYAAFVGNTWNTPVHLTVSRGGASLPVESFARLPVGSGPALTYQAYDNTAGLQPGEVVILFLSGTQGAAPNCPVAPAVGGDAAISGTGLGTSFLIESDVPIAAYQINPYGGGSVAVTGASLLIPTSAWDVNYIAVNAYQNDIGGPSLNIVADQPDTTVTILPVAAIQGGGGIPSGAANQPVSFTLQAGQNAQITQAAELTGSVVQADKPVGFMAGHPCMRTPYGVAYCDHGEQMVPPVQALGNEYVGVMYRPRSGEPAIWRIIGAVDGTTLSWSSSVGGPATLQQGEIQEFITAEPFVVESQDTDHPFLLFTYMSGSQWNQLQSVQSHGYGDVDFVLSYPPEQYLGRYVFFADPTYPETNLVVVRTKDSNGVFHDVNLDCAGNLTGWSPVGDYEWTRVDLITGNFQNVGSCSTGAHEMHSDGRFGLWVWGWGSPETTAFTANVSYGYPGGMNVTPINDVVIPPTPN
jgi:hypothetical protein